jgi:PAS domain S-box-containing protein
MTSAYDESAVAEATVLGADTLAEIVSRTQAGITVTDIDRRYIYANEAACRMLGRSLVDLRGRNLLDSFPEREHATMLAHLPHDLDEDGALFTCMMLGGDGTERAIVCSMYTVEVAGVPHRVSILRDLSAPRSAARAAMALAQATVQGGGAATTDEILALLARHAVEETRCLTARILVVGDDRRVAGGGFGTSGMDFGKASPAWRALSGLPGSDLIAAMTLGTVVIGAPPSEPLVLSDARSVWEASPVMKDYAARMKDLDWRGIVCIPLAWENRVFGVFGISLPSSISGPSEKELAFYTALADQAAVAVMGARLKSQTTQVAAALERARLARDLHDSVSQALFSMTMHVRAAPLSMVKAGLDDGGPLSRSISELTELTRGALAEMRALIFELRPGALAEEGLIAALRKQAAALTAREQVTVTVEANHDQLIALSPDLEEHLFRIVSEALNNVVKHASAESATVRIASEPGHLRIAVRDDGVGFDTSHDRSGHMGLSTMTERAGTIGAELTVESSPGVGTTVTESVRLAGRSRHSPFEIDWRVGWCGVVDCGWAA